MCGLFGFSNYSGGEIRDLPALTKSLSEHSAVRGTDATGIAFCKAGGIQILKEAKPAYKLNFKHPSNIKALIGHTRHSTHGSEKKNYNNHPFAGKAQNTRFALAHNGVLTNDGDLRKQLRLPKTKIETDSYIAVQLIEQKKKLDFESLRYMAESIEGSFSFSLMDDKDNLYLVKGDSPLSILHFPKEKLYVYASTDEILYKSLIASPLFNSLKKREYEEIPINTGEIIRIAPNGLIERADFQYRFYRCKNWWDFGYSWDIRHSDETFDTTYINELKIFAVYQGFAPEVVDDLIHEGFSLEEIEDYIYASE